MANAMSKEKEPGKAQPAASMSAFSSSQRILSVDALRGFDMFFLIGGGGFVAAILQFCGPAAREYLLPQLSHAAWAGFRFEDLIFPLFVYLVGMSTVFSLSRLLVEKGKGAAYRRLIRRSILLFLLGIFYYGGFANRWPDIRLLGVLQRIALCYLFSGILFIHCRARGIAITAVVLLVAYWAMLAFVPTPGTPPDAPAGACFAEKTNWANYIDSKILIGKKHNGTWDPEGLLSTFPAIATCLLGVLSALLLRNPAASTKAKLGWLIGGGLVCLLLGYGWGGVAESLIRKAMGNESPVQHAFGYPFPIIKKIWTSSFVLVAGGYSCLLMGIFYAVIDVWKLQRWAAPFYWIGANAITLYIACNVISFGHIAERLAGGDVQAMFVRLFGEAYGKGMGQLLLACLSLALTLGLARFMYQRKIFVRV